MNKSEFVGRVAEKTELTNEQVQRVITVALAEIGEVLASGGDVSFAGFGKFSRSERAARQGVNPQDPSKKVTIPARVVPRFTPGAVLKQKVADGAS